LRVASLFDYTGNMLQPWLDAGYECHIYDHQHPKGITRRDDGMILHGVDLSVGPTSVEYDDLDFISCFPPCDNLSVSGARWFKGKGLRALEISIGFFASCIEFVDMFPETPYMIENPRSMISTYWRPADETFNPCDYSGYVDGAEDYTKETHIWHGNGFKMPSRNRYGDLFSHPDQTYIHHQSPGKERKNIRSATPKGFAQAVFEANRRTV